MRFHWLRLRASAHPTESVERVAQALHFVSGLADDDFDAALQATDLESHHGGTVVFLEVEVKRNRAIRDAVARLIDPAIMDELPARIDEDGTLYVRFDKQAALQQRLQSTRGEDAVQARFRIEVHPAGRDAAITAWRHVLAA